MEPKSEIRAPARAENKTPVIAAIKNKGAEIAKKVLPERTRKWLTEAASHLQRGNGHKALETMSTLPTESVSPTTVLTDSSIPKEPEIVLKEELGENPTAETKDAEKTSSATTLLLETEDLRDEETAMGMRRTEEKKDVVESKPPSPESAEQQVELAKEQKTTSDDLLQGRNIEALLLQKDNPKAQLAAMVLMSNSYRNFIIRNDGHINWLATADINTVSQTLGLDPETIEARRQTLLDEHKRHAEITREKATQDSRFGWMDKKPQQLQNLITQANQSEAEIFRLYRELMLPIRTAVLSSETLPETYKLNAIEGIKGDGGVLIEEDSLLKQTYASGNEKIKRQIADTVMFNISHDLNSFDVIPIDDLKTLGADIDTMFIATLGNPQTTGEFVETKVAPIFFPDENPTKVRQCYEVLKKATIGNIYHDTSFYSDGYNHNTELMNVDYFKNFMDNSESLIPVVEMLSDYGFQYSPYDSSERKFSQQYLEVLKELGQNLTQLRTEFDSIKAIMPDYKYNYQIGTRYRDSKLERKIESFVDDNPFAIALKQKISPYGIDGDQMNEAVQLFESLQKIVPERWRGNFTSTYIEIMSTTAEHPDRPPEITKRAISEASKYIFDPSLAPDQVELFATNFFKSSLDAKNENTKIAVEFCEKYADKIRTYVEGQEHVDTNSTWYKLSILASDLYRYPIVAGKEDIAIQKAKTDLTHAMRAVSRITDPVIRDKAIANLVYALTDEEIGDIHSAQLFVDLMEDEKLQKESQREIDLENERAKRGETTTWKKMEKVRRSSAASEKFLRDLFGYGSTEDLAKAREQYSQQFHSSPDYWATFSSENQAKLEQEVARISENYNVTLNITWANVLSTLETGKVISAWENPEVMEYRNTSGKYNYEKRRDEIERLIGNRAKGGMRDPHPIYAAAATPNNRDEYYGGTGGGYGECFFVLKTDRIRDRTSFVYDDSFDGYNRWTLDWEGGITAKAIHNLNGSQSRHGYVEAEILGGISIEDIDSINIPSDAISGKKNKYGQSAGSDVLSKIDQLRQRYPNVKINIIQVPTT